MLKSLLQFIIFSVFSLTSPDLSMAHAQEPAERPVWAPSPTTLDHSVSGSNVTLDGVKYKKFTMNGVSFYVLDLGAHKDPDFNHPYCRDLPTSTRVENVPLARTEVPMTHEETMVYFQAVQQVVETGCGDHAMQGNVPNPLLQVGISKTVKQSDGSDRTYELYNQGLGKNLNFGVHY